MARRFDLPRLIGQARKSPLAGARFGGADRNRTDGYRICSPGPYHLATAPCINAVEIQTIRAACAARLGGAGDGI